MLAFSPVSLPLSIILLCIMPSFCQQHHAKKHYLKNFKIVHTFYAIYFREFDDPCFDNFRTFVQRAVYQSSAIKYNFILIGNTVIPRDILARVQNLTNVYIHHVPNHGADLCAFSRVLRRYHERDKSLFQDDKHFFFLNCGARGPYVNIIHDERNALSPLFWLSPYLDYLKHDVKIVGPTISCEIHPHVQSYAALMKAEAAETAMELWDCGFNRSKLEIIRASEVGLSQKLIADGGNIASVALFHGLDFRLQENRYCGLGKDIGRYFNPFLCHNATEVDSVVNIPQFSYKCLHLDPCNTVFIKYGGEAFKDKLLSEQTLGRIRQLDQRWNEYFSMTVGMRSRTGNYQICAK